MPCGRDMQLITLPAALSLQEKLVCATAPSWWQTASNRLPVPLIEPCPDVQFGKFPVPGKMTEIIQFDRTGAFTRRIIDLRCSVDGMGPLWLLKDGLYQLKLRIPWACNTSLQTPSLIFYPSSVSTSATMPATPYSRVLQRRRKDRVVDCYSEAWPPGNRTL